MVPVYGLGSSPAGRPYYAMRLVKGDTLKEAIERYHREGEGPLALRGLLNRFIAVCNAVAYAHSRGILHRDLKPSNILLGPYGETLVVDWGLAKVIGRDEAAVTTSPEATLRPVGSGSGTSDTADGSIVGTPAYMSPEQAEGRLDSLGPASDIYSLGATLYCLLTGRPPFSDGDVAAVLRRVQRGEFSPPRAIRPGVPRALESICLKSMANRPEDRFRSARALAEDLEHWLADEPITAYREPALPRVARWGRRHRPLVAGAAALLLTTVVALVAGLVLLGQASARTERQRLRAEANYTDAQRQRDLARGAVEDYFVQVSEDTLLKSPLPGLQPLRKKLLESALKYYKEFARRGDNDPKSKKELAQAHHRVGAITAEIGTPVDALVLLGQARDQYLALCLADPKDAASRGELARIHRCIGRMELRMEQRVQALASFRTAVALGEELIASDPDVPKFQADLAWGYNNVGGLLAMTGARAASWQSYEHAIRTWEGLVREHRDPQFRTGLGQGYCNFGWDLCVAGRLDEAIETTRKAVDILEGVIHEDGTDPSSRKGLGRSLNNLGVMYFYAGRLVVAEEIYRKALGIAEPLATANHAVTEFRDIEISIHDNLGHLLAQTGRAAEARLSFEAALERATGIPDASLSDSSRAYSYRGLGKLLRDEGRTADALESLRKAVAIGETNPGLPPYSLYELACARALCSAVVGKGKAALTTAEQETKERDADQAMEALRQAVAGGWENVAWIKLDPDLDVLRSRADFRAMIRRLELKLKTEATASPATQTTPSPKS